MDAIESICLRHQFSEGSIERCECPLRERDALRVLESLNHSTFEGALDMIEEFLSEIKLFDAPADTNFAEAAEALDLASLSFSAIDANHDFLMQRDELEAYIANGGCHMSLDWLLCKFAALERLSFFIGGISRIEIERARDLFHGLRFLRSNLESFSKPHSMDEQGAISPEKIQEFLDKNKGHLEEHDERGLNAIIHYIDRVNTIVMRSPS